MPLHVTDFVVRGGGGTITFSNNKTLEYIFKFDVDPVSNWCGTRPNNSNSIFGIELSDPNLSTNMAGLYQTIVDDAVCDIIRWLLQCADAGGVSIPVLSTPPASPSDGDLFISTSTGYNHMLMVYNETLMKWLSMARPELTFSRNNNADNQYLKYGDTDAADSGYLIHRPATILSASVKIGSGEDTKSFEIRKNGSTTALATLTLGGAGATTVKDTALNVDLDEDDYLQFFVVGAGALVKDAVGLIEIAWRQS